MVPWAHTNPRAAASPRVARLRITQYFDHRQACANTNPPPNRLTISSVDFAQTRPGPVRNWLNVKGPTEPDTETAERPQGGHYHSRLGPGPRQQLDQPRDDRVRRLLQLRLRLMHPQRQSLNNTWQTRCLPLRRQFHTALTNNVYYFWQPKAGLSPHAHANTKNTYIQTCQTLQMLLIIGYSVWYK